MGPDFFHCMFDTLLFICERGFQCMKSGNLDPIYHSGSSYEKWYDKAMLLKSQAKLMSDPEAHGLNKFSFLKDLNDIIDQGRTITKYAAKLSTYEKSITRTMLGEMETLRCTELSKRAAQKSREHLSLCCSVVVPVLVNQPYWIWFFTKLLRHLIIRAIPNSNTLVFVQILFGPVTILQCGSSL